jgi:Asp-tRNA(Asn)/Glu-tRNA(Gln) amidotransferase A subunit family amidase
MRLKHHLLLFFMIVFIAVPIPGFSGAVAAAPVEVSDSFDLEEATIASIQEQMESGDLTSEELVHYYLDRIEAYDQQGPSVNSIISMNENAVEEAIALDEERENDGPRSPLHGIPIIVKDNFDMEGMATSAGCLCLRDSVAADDSFQVKKLKEAGAIILAKSNLHEFAFGITTESSLGGQTLNPYNLAHNPGGSSGGTAASVASNFAVAGLGTDTGGSIRIPSAFNSLVGIRTTMGLASRDGIIPLALTQDIGGPMTRTVEDTALLLDATVGYDPNDIETAKSINNYPETYTAYLNADGLEDAKIGVIRELFQRGDAEVNALVDQAILDMEAAGAEVIDVEIDNLSEITAYPSLSSWEFKFQLNDYLEAMGDAAPYSSLTEIIESGEYLDSIERSLIERNERETLDTEEYKDILLFRTQESQNGLLKGMADHELDALLYPTSTNPPAEIGRGQSSGSNNRLSAFSGFPAITVPAGFTENGLPVGVEFLSRPFEEATLIELAYSYEQHTEHRQAPHLINKVGLEEVLEEIAALNERVYTTESWENLQDAVLTANEVLNDEEATQQEVNDALESLEQVRDALVVIGLSELIVLVEQFNNEGEIHDDTVRILTMHLTAVEIFANEGQTDKVIRHVSNLQSYLIDQHDNEFISEEAFEAVDFVLNHLIDELDIEENDLGEAA